MDSALMRSRKRRRAGLISGLGGPEASGEDMSQLIVVMRTGQP